VKKAIVIGASSGIGRELSLVLAKNRYVVGAMARRVQLLDELRREIGSNVFSEPIDVANSQTSMEALGKLISTMGGVDLVVISAGTGHLNEALEWPFEDETIRTNVTGFTAMANVAIKHFISKGTGHLVGISSLAALRGSRICPAYNASKAFESNYLEGLRCKMRKLKLPIAITDVRPGFVKTRMAQGEGIFWAADADKAALQIYDAIKRKASIAYITRRWRMVSWLMKSMPRFIYERL